MPKNKTDDRLKQWEELLKAVREGEAELSGVASFREALEHAYAQAVSARKRRDELRLASQEETLRMYQALEGCHDAGISLRHFIKSLLGSRAEKLSHFGITPRKRRRAIRKLSRGCEPPLVIPESAAPR